MNSKAYTDPEKAGTDAGEAGTNPYRPIESFEHRYGRVMSDINLLFADVTVSQETTREALKTIREEIDILIEAIPE